MTDATVLSPALLYINDGTRGHGGRYYVNFSCEGKGGQIQCKDKGGPRGYTSSTRLMCSSCTLGAIGVAKQVLVLVRNDDSPMLEGGLIQPEVLLDVCLLEDGCLILGLDVLPGGDVLIPADLLLVVALVSMEGERDAKRLPTTLGLGNEQGGGFLGRHDASSRRAHS